MLMATIAIPRNELAGLPSRIFALLIDGALLSLLSGVLYPFIRNPGVEGVLGTVLEVMSLLPS
jgi:uncharacterized RDD family membrane protein YckC